MQVIGCPFCGGKVTHRCRCLREDSDCVNGHKWHRCTKHGTVVAEQGDHEKSGCSCVPGKTYKLTLVPVEQG